MPRRHPTVPTEAPRTTPISIPVLRAALLARRAALRQYMLTNRIANAEAAVEAATKTLAHAKTTLARAKKLTLTDMDLNDYNIEAINRLLTKLDARGSDIVPMNAYELTELTTYCGSAVS